MEEEIDQNDEVITVDGNAFVKNNDGSLVKLIGEEYDESSLIYR